MTTNSMTAYRFGTVGKPLPGVDVRLAGDGEILVRGPVVFSGYFKEPEKSAEVLDPEGWYATGDVGAFDADGFLRITDRKKDIIVTAGGKNVAPQNIENALKRSRYVSQAMVHGDRRQFLSCLLTLDPDSVVPWARGAGLPVDDWTTLCARPEIRELAQGEIERVNADLARFETVKRFAILPDEFTVEGGELTPTLKVKRRVVEERYRAALDKMYT